MRRVFVGFGIGPIQASIFARQARASGFDVVAVVEIDAGLVDAVRRHGDRYRLHIAGPGGIGVVSVEGVRLLNPLDPADRREAAAWVAEATLGATALPSVEAYGHGGEIAVAAWLAAGLAVGDAPATFYTAENRPGAGRLLEREVNARARGGVQSARPSSLTPSSAR